MAFGQSAGPPATGKQIRELTELMEAAGHLDFRDARGPLGLNQRQAGGKFTRDEADELISRLQVEAEASADSTMGSDEHATTDSDTRPRTAPVQRRVVPKPTRLAKVPSQELAAELQSRGWIVVEP